MRSDNDIISCLIKLSSPLDFLLLVREASLLPSLFGSM